MFSLREMESGSFVYRCHGCGREIELKAMDKVAAADAAVARNETHERASEVRPSSDTPPKAS